VAQLDITTPKGRRVQAQATTWLERLPRALIVQAARVQYSLVTCTLIRVVALRFLLTVVDRIASAHKAKAALHFDDVIYLDRYMLIHKARAAAARQAAANSRRRLAAVWRRRCALAPLPEALKTSLAHLRARADGRRDGDVPTDAMIDDTPAATTATAVDDDDDDDDDDAAAARDADEAFVDALVAEHSQPIPALDAAIQCLLRRYLVNYNTLLISHFGVALNASIVDAEARLAAYDRAANELRAAANKAHDSLNSVAYRLAAVCVHSGVPSSGHYWAHVRRSDVDNSDDAAAATGDDDGADAAATTPGCVGGDGRLVMSKRAKCAWTRFNDRRVTVVTSEEVRGANVMCAVVVDKHLMIGLARCCWRTRDVDSGLPPALHGGRQRGEQRRWRSAACRRANRYQRCQHVCRIGAVAWRACMATRYGRARERLVS
jgi:hypothetical protein